MSKKRQNPTKGSSQQKGQDFEELIEKLEKILATNDIQVERNVQIYDDEIEDTRQIDVLLRIKTGAYEFIVIIECRDRSAVEDVIWIEQLAAKGKAVHASKTVAVSSSGFTKNAIKKARKNGIILRKIDDTIIADLAEWFKISKLEIVRNDVRVAGISFIASDNKAITPEQTQMIASQLNTDGSPSTSKPILRVPKTGRLVSIDDLWTEFVALNPDTNDGWTRKLLDEDITMIPENVTFTMHEVVEIIGFSDLKIKYIQLEVQIMLARFSIPIKRALSYLEDGNALVNLVNLEQKIDNRDFSVDISKANEKIEINITVPPDISLIVESYSSEDRKK
jgi:hypothetical protein